jgi:hypothetical protein
MQSVGSVMGAWHPTTESERQLVLSQLERVVSEGIFTASKRYPQLLRYIVEQTLAGNEDHLKERTLGVEVFHRPPSYDTNLDPVVRHCAVEVRKRLTQYYQSPEHVGELRIELNPGSYVPVFLLSDQDRPSSEAIPAGVPPQGEQTSQPGRTGKSYWQAGLIVGLIASIAVVAVIFVLVPRIRGHADPRLVEKQKSALDEVWSPLLASSKPILFCMGGTDSFAVAPQDSPMKELQSVADDDSSLQAITDKNDFVPFSDLQTFSRFVFLIGTHGHAYTVQSFRTTVSRQLREGPVVLIGALNNDWTINRTSPLRFHFEGPEGPNQNYWIMDTQHPDFRAWQITTLARRSPTVKDYAIAARFNDEGTGQVVLVAAGITGSGTRAAGEFLTDEASLKQLADSANADWRKANFEVVLSSQVVNGMQGKPKVEAKVFW